ncbi:16S rRNA (guanine(966)-N(2))-methyltransferase RsmD [Occallatibacter savannae]|uniref:16S rRNA (guanine(966)-N(2))-methyltransferase RsmD n=1 Tax=Occallatibacter savannae TaxID=1002691 RepID=UPI000D68EE23|nr:16S rRNA (guanine(966)-N(2))-methyltransferase RsmD [Occallatibacter savannae]
MRVIAGTLRRRTLEAPAGIATRPTSDRLRETLFNVLAPRTEGARFLDLYAGSGAVGIEAASRGAERVVLVERAEAALKILRKNLESLGLRGTARVEQVSVAAFLKKIRPESTGFVFDVIFLDPPYDAADEYQLALGLLGGEASRLLAEDAVIVAEHRRRDKLDERFGVLERTRVLEQGDAGLSFYKAVVSSQSPVVS